MKKNFFIKKKGFTLIELLAVIVILAIILLIVMPIIITVIDDARKGGFEASARGLVKVVETSYFARTFENELGEQIYEFENGAQISGETLKFSGQAPRNGVIHVNEAGKVTMAIEDGVWCAQKTFENNEITMTKLSEVVECTLPVGGGEIVIGDGRIIFYKDESTDTLHVIREGDSRIDGAWTRLQPSDYGNGDTEYASSAEEPSIMLDVSPGGTSGGSTIAHHVNHIVVYSGITHLGDNVFNDYGNPASVESILLPDGLEVIGDFALNRLALTELVIPETVSIIGDRSLISNNLASISIPESVEIIGSETFSGNNLETVIFHKNNDITIGYQAFISNGPEKNSTAAELHCTSGWSCTEVDNFYGTWNLNVDGTSWVLE